MEQAKNLNILKCLARKTKKLILIRIIHHCYRSFASLNMNCCNLQNYSQSLKTKFEKKEKRDCLLHLSFPFKFNLTVQKLSEH